MSTVQRQEVILDHREKVKQGDPLHYHISHDLKRHDSNLNEVKEKLNRRSYVAQNTLERDLELHDKHMEKENAINSKLAKN